MSKYTKLTAAFKAITIDVTQLNSKLLNAEKLNAKNILVETGYNQLSDIVSYIKEKDNEVSSKFVESTYTVDKMDGNSGNVVLFIIPCDAYPQNVPFSRMSVPVTSGVPQMETGGETTPVYLGVILWNADGTKEIYGISDNQVTCNKFSTATWNFDTKPIVFTNDYRLIFYFIANREDFITTEPTVYKDKIKITTRLHPTLDNIDPYYNWSQALTDLRLGWICNDLLRQGSSYPNWPACTFTTSKLTELFLTFPNILSTVDTHTNLIDDLYQKVTENQDSLENEVQLLNEKTQEIDNIFYEKYDNYNTVTFSLDIEKGQSDTSSFRLGYKHTPNGIIKKVSLYARSGGGTFDCNTNGCYLLVQRYNKATSELISSYLSKNKVIVQKNSESTPLLNTWEFDGFESCKEGEVLKFMPTSGDSPVANYYIGLLIDPYHTHDDCNVGGDTFVDGVNTTPLGAGSKWVAYVQFEGDFYRESDFKTHPNDASKHLKSIERPVIESLYTTAKEEIWNNNINNVSLGNASCKGFKLERPYISNCVFNEMRWTTTSGTEDCTCYLKVTLNDTRGKEICSYFSNNTESFNSTGLKSFRFNKDIEITDKIGSITCEISLDGINVVTTENKRIRVVSVGTSANNTTDGTELTNANIITHVIFYGNKPTSLLTSHIGDDTHLTTAQKDTISDYTSSKNSFATKSDVDSTYAKNATLFGGEHRTATGNDNTQSWSAVRIPSAYVPHLQPIHEVKLTTLNTNETTPMYLGAVAISDNEQQRQLLKLSTNSLTWTANSEVKWEFGEDGFAIPAGYQLELYLIANESDFVLPVPAADVLLQSSMNGSIGVGKLYPVSGTWGGPRLLDCILVTKAHVKDVTHLTEEEKTTLQQLVQNGGVTTDSYDWTPDYSAGVEFACSPVTTYTAPCNGWVIVYQNITTTDGTPKISVNDIEILSLLNMNEDDLSITGELSGQFLVGKNDIISGGVAGQKGKFYPCKAETAE